LAHGFTQSARGNALTKTPIKKQAEELAVADDANANSKSYSGCTADASANYIVIGFPANSRRVKVSRTLWPPKENAKVRFIRKAPQQPHMLP